MVNAMPGSRRRESPARRSAGTGLRTGSFPAFPSAGPAAAGPRSGSAPPPGGRSRTARPASPAPVPRPVPHRPGRAARAVRH
ncbi:hypothetical protein G6F35_018955 [Rhizopus arrhizus]|nr:hypothetical protein G6F35_018955 [Rhizopus arrhizus]